MATLLNLIAILFSSVWTIAVKGERCVFYQPAKYQCTAIWTEPECSSGYKKSHYEWCEDKWGWWKNWVCKMEFDWPCGKCGEQCPTPKPTLQPYTPPSLLEGAGDQPPVKIVGGDGWIELGNWRMGMFSKGSSNQYSIFSICNQFGSYRTPLWFKSDGTKVIQRKTNNYCHWDLPYVNADRTPVNVKFGNNYIDFSYWRLGYMGGANKVLALWHNPSHKVRGAKSKGNAMMLRYYNKKCNTDWGPRHDWNPFNMRNTRSNIVFGKRFIQIGEYRFGESHIEDNHDTHFSANLMTPLDSKGRTCLVLSGHGGAEYKRTWNEWNLDSYVPLGIAVEEGETPSEDRLQASQFKTTYIVSEQTGFVLDVDEKSASSSGFDPIVDFVMIDKNIAVDQMSPENKNTIGGVRKEPYQVWKFDPRGYIICDTCASLNTRDNRELALAAYSTWSLQVRPINSDTARWRYLWDYDPIERQFSVRGDNSRVLCLMGSDKSDKDSPAGVKLTRCRKGTVKGRAADRFRMKAESEMFPERHGRDEYFYIVNEGNHRVIWSPQEVGMRPIQTSIPQGDSRQLWQWDQSGRLTNKKGETMELADHLISQMSIPKDVKIGQTLKISWDQDPGYYWREPAHYGHLAYAGSKIWYAVPDKTTREKNGEVLPISERVVTTNDRKKGDKDWTTNFKHNKNSLLEMGDEQEWFWSSGKMVSAHNSRVFEIQGGMHQHRINEDILASKPNDKLMQQKWYLMPEDLTRDWIDMIAEAKNGNKGINPIKKAYIYHTMARKHIRTVIGSSPESLMAKALMTHEGLRAAAKDLSKSGRDTTISQITTGALQVVGGVMTMAGIVLAPISWGASLSMSLQGSLLATAPHVTNAYFNQKFDSEEAALKQGMDDIAKDLSVGALALGSFLTEYKNAMEELSVYVDSTEGENELMNLMNESDKWWDEGFWGTIPGKTLGAGIDMFNLGAAVAGAYGNFDAIQRLMGIRAMIHDLGLTSSMIKDVTAGWQLADTQAHGLGDTIVSVIDFMFGSSFGEQGWRGLDLGKWFSAGAAVLSIVNGVRYLAAGLVMIDDNQLLSRQMTETADWLRDDFPKMFDLYMHVTGDYEYMKNIEGMIEAAKETPEDEAPVENDQPVKCANEGEKCECDGTVVYGVRFKERNAVKGAESSYADMMQGTWASRTKRKVVDGSIACTNDVFGDPVFGFLKQCFCLSETAIKRQIQPKKWANFEDDSWREIHRKDGKNNKFLLKNSIWGHLQDRKEAHSVSSTNELNKRRRLEVGEAGISDSLASFYANWDYSRIAGLSTKEAYYLYTEEQ